MSFRAAGWECRYKAVRCIGWLPSISGVLYLSISLIRYATWALASIQHGRQWFTGALWVGASLFHYLYSGFRGYPHERFCRSVSWPNKSGPQILQEFWIVPSVTCSSDWYWSLLKGRYQTFRYWTCVLCSIMTACKQWLGKNVLNYLLRIHPLLASLLICGVRPRWKFA